MIRNKFLFCIGVDAMMSHKCGVLGLMCGFLRFIFPPFVFYLTFCFCITLSGSDHVKLFFAFTCCTGLHVEESSRGTSWSCGSHCSWCTRKRWNEPCDYCITKTSSSSWNGPKAILKSCLPTPTLDSTQGLSCSTYLESLVSLLVLYIYPCSPIHFMCVLAACCSTYLGSFEAALRFFGAENWCYLHKQEKGWCYSYENYRECTWGDEFDENKFYEQHAASTH